MGATPTPATISSTAAVAEIEPGIRLLNETHAGATPAGSANLNLLSGIRVVHPAVNRDGAGASPA